MSAVPQIIPDDSIPTPCEYNIEENKEDSQTLGKKLQLKANAVGYFIVHLDRTSERHRMITVICPYKHRTIMSCMVDWNNPKCIMCESKCYPKNVIEHIYSESNTEEYPMNLNQPINSELDRILEQTTVDEDLERVPNKLSRLDRFCEKHKLKVDNYVDAYKKSIWICHKGHKFITSFNALKSQEKRIHFSLCKYCDIFGYQDKNKITCIGDIPKSFNRISMLKWRCNKCGKDFSSGIRSKPRCLSC